MSTRASSLIRLFFDGDRFAVAGCCPNAIQLQGVKPEEKRRHAVPDAFDTLKEIVETEQRIQRCADHERRLRAEGEHTLAQSWADAAETAHLHLAALVSQLPDAELEAHLG